MKRNYIKNISIITLFFVLGFSLYKINTISASTGLLKFEQGLQPHAVIQNTNAVSFNYQGFLMLADGSLANGVFDMQIAIYDRPEGGASLHLESFANENGVLVQDGYFNAILGNDGENPLLADVFNGEPKFVGVTVENSEELAPRQQILPVPYSIAASKLVGNAEISGDLVVEGDLNARNQDDQRASVALGWQDNQALIRIGGPVGSGAEGGFQIQSISDVVLFDVTDSGNVTFGRDDRDSQHLIMGNLTVDSSTQIQGSLTSNNSMSVNSVADPRASVSLSWDEKQARIRVAGPVGSGAEGGFQIQSISDVVLFDVTDSGNVTFGRDDRDSQHLIMGNLTVDSSTQIQGSLTSNNSMSVNSIADPRASVSFGWDEKQARIRVGGPVGSGGDGGFQIQGISDVILFDVGRMAMLLLEEMEIMITQ